MSEKDQPKIPKEGFVVTIPGKKQLAVPIRYTDLDPDEKVRNEKKRFIELLDPDMKVYQYALSLSEFLKHNRDSKDPLFRLASFYASLVSNVELAGDGLGVYDLDDYDPETKALKEGARRLEDYTNKLRELFLGSF